MKNMQLLSLGYEKCIYFHGTEGKQWIDHLDLCHVNPRGTGKTWITHQNCQNMNDINYNEKLVTNKFYQQ